jgi:hypothetical protein
VDGDKAKTLSCLICFSRNKQLNNLALFSETVFEFLVIDPAWEVFEVTL